MMRGSSYIGGAEPTRLRGFGPNRVINTIKTDDGPWALAVR